MKNLIQSLKTKIKDRKKTIEELESITEKLLKEAGENLAEVRRLKYWTVPRLQGALDVVKKIDIGFVPSSQDNLGVVNITENEQEPPDLGLMEDWEKEAFSLNLQEKGDVFTAKELQIQLEDHGFILSLQKIVGWLLKLEAGGAVDVPIRGQWRVL